MTRLDVIDAEVRGRGFRFQIDGPNGLRQFELPHMNSIPKKVFAQMNAMPATLERNVWLLEQATTKENVQAILEVLPIDDFNALMDAWVQHAGVGAGLGKVLTVFEILENHTPAVEGDVRNKFNISGAVGLVQLSLREICWIVEALTQDISSRTVASIEGWPYTWSMEAKIAADNYDLSHKKAAGKRKIKPYPRPYSADGTEKFAKKTKTSTKNPQNSFELLKKYRQNKEHPNG